MWSYEEFEKRLEEYWSVANARENRLLKIFFALLAVALGIIVLMIVCILPKFIGITIEFGVLIGFCLLAVYVLSTAEKFHRTHCVVCVHCGGSLLSLGEELAFLTEDGVERPKSLACPKCHQVVVVKKTA